MDKMIDELIECYKADKVKIEKQLEVVNLHIDALEKLKGKGDKDV